MKISAVIDIYNSEAFIAEAIESVVAQERLPDELIIVDDGSTDGTVEAIKEAIAALPYARLIEQENGGQLKCLTTGVLAASGDLIALLDGDDLWKPSHLREAEEKFQEHPGLSLYFCDYETLGVEHIGALKKLPEMLLQSTFGLTALSEAFVGDITATLVMRADCVKPHLPLPAELEREWVINADNVFVWLTCFTGRQKYSSCAQNVIYRIHQASMHKQYNNAVVRARKRLATKRLFEYFRREFYIPQDVGKVLRREFRAHGSQDQTLKKMYRKAQLKRWPWG